MDNLGPVLGWYLLGVALIVAELFVPGGVIGTIGTVSVVYALYLAYTQSALWVALLLTGAAAVGVPLIILWGMRRASIRDAVTATTKPDGLEALVGKEGVAEGLLRPEGPVRVDGKRHDGKAELGYIEAGARVEVIGVAGTALVVRERKG